MRRPSTCTLLAVVSIAGNASAAPDLTLHHTPVRSLKMRRAWRKVAAAPSAPSARPAAPPPALLSPDPNPEPTVRAPDQAVAFQLDIGYAIDGTQLSDDPKTLGGRTAQLGADFAQIRDYGFADTSLSTHGVGITPLTTYFSARYELTQPLTVADPQTSVGSKGTVTVPLAPPIASWFDHSNLMVRSGWAELTDVLPTSWGMPITVRLGQQYVYGPWVMHIQGAVAEWKGKILDATVYAGRRAPDYTYALLDSDQPTITGAQVKLDLHETTLQLPVVFAGDVMKLDFEDGTSSTSYQGEVDWRPVRDVVVLGAVRALDGSLAHEHVQLRGRYHDVTNYALELQGRQAADWQWDPSLVGQPTDATEARRYLDLGPVQPQLLASLRAGTVLFENIDLLGRAAYALDLTDNITQATSQNASYRELAGAAEVRLRRSVAIGASILRRVIQHPTQDAPIADVAGPQPLPDQLFTGQDNFTEIGANAKMSLGDRRFSASVEVYGRRTVYADLYCLPLPGGECSTVEPGYLTSDIRGGGRVTVDAHVNSRLRLFAAYDLSSSLALAPEITGYKSLRLVMEGIY